jgi:hypothetical protein
LHFHAVVLDGVFAPNSQGRQAFYETGAPSHDELEDVVKRIRGRALRWLRKRGLFDDRRAEERSNEAPERSALDACAEVALRGGELGRLEDGFVVPPEDGSEARLEPRCRGPLTAELDGFNMEAAVRIEACDDEGRERLVRYCARPCFALERLSILRDGRVDLSGEVPAAKRNASGNDAGCVSREARRVGAAAALSARALPRRARAAREATQRGGAEGAGEGM